MRTSQRRPPTTVDARTIAAIGAQRTSSEQAVLDRLAARHGWTLQRVETSMWPLPGFELTSPDGEIVLLCPSTGDALSALREELDPAERAAHAR